MKFSEIPLRDNGLVTVDKSWWNSLKAAGESLEGTAGGGVTTELQQTIANDDGPTAVTGLSLNASLYSYYLIELNVKRRTDTEFRRSVYVIEAFFDDDDDSWSIGVSEKLISGKNPGGVTFTIDDTDTDDSPISYTSNNQSGDNYLGTVRWKVVKTFDIES